MLSLILETKDTYIIMAGDMMQDRSFQQFQVKMGWNGKILVFLTVFYWVNC
jgi:hypothetical protein